MSRICGDKNQYGRQRQSFEQHLLRKAVATVKYKEI